MIMIIMINTIIIIMGMIIVIMKIIIGKGGYEPPARGRRYVDCKNQITAIADDYPN